ncbi:MMPL family transporter [Emcibacter sp. SYSU 3D8]|uniref:MMPL family transporter n=1 Tax=Emcibacter sp. SYSU 3D8 TaxID=3133969 RepID=UPI0031FE4C41
MRLSPVPSAVALSCRHPALVALAAVLLCALAAWYVSGHFKMTTKTEELIASDVNYRMRNIAMEKAFPQVGDLIVAVIDAKTPELAESAAARLEERLQADTTNFAGVRRPDGGAFFSHAALLYGSVEDVEQATDAMVAAQPFLGQLSYDPSLRGVMDVFNAALLGIRSGETTFAQIDKPLAALADAMEAVNAGRPAYFSWQAILGDGGGSRLQAPLRRFILVKPRLDYQSLMPGKQASDAIRESARDLGLDPDHGVTVRLTGSVAMEDEEFASLAHNIWLVSTAIIGCMLLMLWLATRSLRTVAAIMTTTMAGLLITMALGLVTVGRFNLISVAFIPLFVGLGIDFGIQLSVRFRQERLTEPDPKLALRRAADALGGALTLAAAGICLGFLAFLPTSYVGISELGIIAAAGMAVALALNVTLLPALLLLFRSPLQSLEVGRKALAPVDAFLLRRRKLVLWTFGLLMAASIAGLPLVKFDFNPLHLRDQNGEAVATLHDLMSDPDRTLNTIDVLMPGPDEAAALGKKLAALPEVSQAITISSFVPADQDAKLALIGDTASLLDPTLNPMDAAPPPTDAETAASLSETARSLRTAAVGRDDAANALRLAGALETLVDGPAERRVIAEKALIEPFRVLLDQTRAALMAQPVTMADLPQDLVRDWVSEDGRARIQVFPTGDSNDNATLKRFAHAIQSVAPDASGPPISVIEAGDTISGAFVQAGILALIAITLLLLAVLRSVTEVAATLAPIVLSGFLTLGTCVLIQLPINFANIIAFPLLFGVGVAFHIYFVMAWRAGEKDLLQSSLARAVLFSALATGAAFGSLWLSDHPGTASMGKVLVISLVWTLICALIFEPALLGTPRGAPENDSEDPGTKAA